MLFDCPNRPIPFSTVLAIQTYFPPLHKKFDVDLNSRGVSVYVSDNNS